MTEAEQKLQEIKEIVQDWLDKQGHERCWYYPDLFQRLAVSLNIQPTVDPSLPSREEFEHGCRRYQDEQYEHKDQSSLTCICPKECDCVNPWPDDWNGKSGSWAISNYCPIHNNDPDVVPECRAHTKG